MPPGCCSENGALAGILGVGSSLKPEWRSWVPLTKALFKGLGFKSSKVHLILETYSTFNGDPVLEPCRTILEHCSSL